MVRSGIPAQYWDNIIQKIESTTLEVVKQSVIKRIPQEQLLQTTENNVVKVYKQSIEELEQKGLIDHQTEINAESQSNIDTMAKQAQ